MYTQFFNLKQAPFSIAPDPRYLLMTHGHREALAHLMYGINSGGGLVLLTGEVGAGKTTVCRCFLEQVPRRCNVAYIFNPKLTVEELLKSICDEFHIPYQHQGAGVPTVKDYLDPLNEFLLKTHAVGQNNVLIIDEAQNLSADVLEQLRLLTNLETNERKLLQIVLIGQPELRTMLARPELEQLAQRVIARFHLEALSEAETAQYVRHRLAVAGMTTAIPFDRRALARIHRLSRGVPRRINLLCDRALLGAYAEGKTSVQRRIVDKAAHEVFDDMPAQRTRARTTLAGLGLAAGAALFGVVTLAMDGSRLRLEPAVVPPAATLAAVALAASAPAPVVVAPPAPLVLGAAELKTRFGPPGRQEREAWRELAASWKLELADGDPCLLAQRQHVQCFKSASSSLALIRQLGRPGIVTLHDDEDQPVYALLTGLDEAGATLRIGGVSRTVSLASLAEIWRGDFSTFWRAPPGYQKTIGAGAPLAGWLAKRLATLQGAAPDAQALKPRVQAFQLAQGLQADGVAGPVTLMQLNRATGVDEPRLESER